MVRLLYRAALAIGIIFSCASHGDINVGVEPYLGYSQFTYSTAGVSDSKLGPVLGGKGGLFISDTVWVALDYHLGGPYHLANNDNEFLNHMWGAGLGFGKKGGARAWLGYYFSNVLDDVEANAQYRGTAIKLSVGYEFRAKVSVNLEYCKQTFTEGHYAAATSPLPSNLDVSVFFLSLSAPLILN